MIKRVVIFGSTSSIGKVLIPIFKANGFELASINRIRSNGILSDFPNSRINLNIDFEQPIDAEREILAYVKSFGSEPILLLNLMGRFGEAGSVDSFDIQEALTVYSINLIPYYVAAKIGAFLPRSSLVISFSGAGVGGKNLDDSSLGYLSAKSAMVLLCESIDKQLKTNDVRFGMISPGAFPSPMQKVVAEADDSVIDIEKKRRAQEVLNSSPSAGKLYSLIEFLMRSPNQAGGRLWSANFDEPLSHEDSSEFGHMRRIF